MIDFCFPLERHCLLKNSKFKTENSKFECKSYNFLPPASMHPFLSIFTNSGQGQNNCPLPPCDCPA